MNRLTPPFFLVLLLILSLVGAGWGFAAAWRLITNTGEVVGSLLLSIGLALPSFFLAVCFLALLVVRLRPVKR